MIKRVTAEDFDKFESFVEKSENGHFMQSLKWAAFKKNQKHFAIMSIDGSGDIRGTMLLFLQNVRRTNKVFLYCPRGPVCSRKSDEVLTELLDGAKALAQELGAYKLTLDPDICADDKTWLDCFERYDAKIGDNAKDNAILQPLAVFRIDVNKADDELMMSYHSKARYSVRSSIKSGAVCRIVGRDEIPVFCELLANTAKNDGFTARESRYFFDMYDALGEDCFKLFLVEYEGKPIAGSVLLKYGAKSWHMYAGSSDEYKETLPNFLMQWEMMRWSRDKGAYLYDMRGIAGEGDKLKPIEGLVRFKKRFGGDLVSFVGRIDIIYNKRADRCVKILKGAVSALRKITGRK